MSYANPTITYIDNPVGLDAVIQDIQLDLAQLPWLTWVFGRAREHKETAADGKKVLRIPKVYVGDGEYMSVLPNDFAAKGMAFFATKDMEVVKPPYERFVRNNLTRRLSIIFWFSLENITSEKDYIYTEELKADVLKVLKGNDWVLSIDGYVDERADQVYDAWNREALYARYSLDEKTDYLMYPYSGFRFDITVSYLENC